GSGVGLVLWGTGQVGCDHQDRAQGAEDPSGDEQGWQPEPEAGDGHQPAHGRHDGTGAPQQAATPGPGHDVAFGSASGEGQDRYADRDGGRGEVDGVEAGM